MLSINNVSFAYRDGSVLDSLDLEFHDGERVGVVGPNGAGKTTLIKLVSGLLRPNVGGIEVDGADLATLRASERARLVSVVPQSPQLPLGFSVLDLVLMGRNPHLKLLQWERQSDVDVASHAMELTDIGHLSDRALATLSGGERQRAVIAMALAQEAPLLLLDEPTASLDLAHQTGVMDLVRDIQDSRGGAVLIAMHDLTLAALYCDRIVMLAEGRCYAEGPPADVLTTENIARVYGSEVHVLTHPQAGTPVVLPVPNGHSQINGPA